MHAAALLWRILVRNTPVHDLDRLGPGAAEFMASKNYTVAF